jgi:hypothetical protein
VSAAPAASPRHALARWHAAYDRNRTLAAADYVRRVAQAARLPELRDPAALRRDLVVVSGGLAAVLALHSPPPQAGRRAWNCRGCTARRGSHAAWPCATHRALLHAIEPFGVLP